MSVKVVLGFGVLGFGEGGLAMADVGPVRRSWH